MDRRRALKAVVAGCIGVMSGQAIFTRPAKGGGIIDEVNPNVESKTVGYDYNWKPTNVRWDMGAIESVTLILGDRKIVLKTKDIFDSLYT